MYLIIRCYEDITSATEIASDFLSVLRACEIYLEDPDCCIVKVIDNKTGKVVVDYVK